MGETKLYVRIFWLVFINLLCGFAIYYTTEWMNQKSTPAFLLGSAAIMLILFFLFDQFYKFVKNLKN